MVGKIHFDLSKRALQSFKIDGKSRGYVDVQQVGVEFAVFEKGQICARILCKLCVEICENLIEARLVRDVTEQNADAEPCFDKRICAVNAEICRDVDGLGVESAVVLVHDACRSHGDLRACLVSCEHQREYAVKNGLGDVDFDLLNVENVAVHLDVDLIENGGDKSHNVGRAAVSRRFCAVLDDDVCVLNELVVLCVCGGIALDCSLYGCKELVNEIADEFVDVDVVDFEFRAASAENSACVKIYAFFCAVIVCGDTFCFVSAAHFGCKSGLIGIFGVDDALQHD